jgi:hypothetical protein
MAISSPPLPHGISPFVEVLSCGGSPHTLASKIILRYDFVRDDEVPVERTTWKHATLQGVVHLILKE